MTSPEGLYEPVGGGGSDDADEGENLDAIVDALRAQGLNPIVRNTICSATRRRRNTAQVAEQVDAMVVIGGRNSSNTTRLAEICAEHCLARTTSNRWTSCAPTFSRAAPAWA